MGYRRATDHAYNKTDCENLSVATMMNEILNNDS